MRKQGTGREHSSIDNGSWIFRVSIGLFVLLAIAQVLAGMLPAMNPNHPRLAHTMGSIHEYLPLLVLGLMLYFIRRFEETGRGAAEFAATGTTLLAQLNALKADTDDVRRKFMNSESVLRGRILFYEGKYEPAVAIFRQITKDELPESRNIAAHEWLGRSLFQLHVTSQNRKEPRQWLRETIVHLRVATEAKEDGDLFALLGEAERRLGQWEHSAEHLQRALELGDGVAGLEEKAAWSLVRVAVRRSPQQEGILMQVFLDKYPGHTGAVRDYVRYLSGHGKLDEAINQCNTSIGARPKVWGLYPLRAKMLFTRGTNADIQQALRDLEFAKTCNPQDYNLYLVAAEFWLERALESAAMNEQRNELLIKAISVCSEGLKHAKVPAPLEIAIASAYLALGDIPKAEAQAKNAVNHSPYHSNNYVVLAAAFLAGGRFGSVQNTTNRIRTLRPSKGFEIYSYLYEVIAAMALKQTVDECSDLVEGLAREIRAFPSFVPNHNSWWLVRSRVEEHVKTYSAREASLLSLLQSYLDQDVENSIFATSLERTARGDAGIAA